MTQLDLTTETVGRFHRCRWVNLDLTPCGNAATSGARYGRMNYLVCPLHAKAIARLNRIRAQRKAV